LKKQNGKESKYVLDSSTFFTFFEEEDDTDREKVYIRAKDLKSGGHNIKSIVMDTGASYTPLEVDVRREMDYILIDRNCQEEFKLTFEAQRMMYYH